MPSPNLRSDTCRVYLEYSDLINGPPRPPSDSGSWTRWVCISDTHSRLFNLPPGDVLLHSGDLSSWGYPSQIKDSCDWIKSLPHPVKIVIAGNHDIFLDQNYFPGERAALSEVDDLSYEELIASLRDSEDGFHYLQHEALTITSPSGREWRIYGSPASPLYSSGAFQYSTNEQAHQIYSQIPDDTEILLTHTPPKNILDLTRRCKNAGCGVLTNRIDDLDCRLHVFGHIHESHGAKIVQAEGEEKSVDKVFVNAAVFKRGLPIIVDLKD
ncbi:Metallo-dependent phosphatase [Flagelloscypha sp. PMI_526]|nr:Metallo-dependent phosphatase [Flagelloscypha sp. PMI_526]